MRRTWVRKSVTGKSRLARLQVAHAEHVFSRVYPKVTVFRSRTVLCRADKYPHENIMSHRTVTIRTTTPSDERVAHTETLAADPYPQPSRRVREDTSWQPPPRGPCMCCGKVGESASREEIVCARCAHS